MYGCRIRRMFSPRQPGTLAPGEQLVTAAHPKASALTSRSAGGLGRDLAGILDRAGSRSHRQQRPGLQQLLGRRVSVTPPRVRQFVIETALSVIAEGFGAEAVAIARLDEAGRPVVASRIPPSWEESSSLTFELYGQLWTLLDSRGASIDPEVRPGGRPRSATRAAGGQQDGLLGQLSTWLGWQATASGDLAAAVVRRQPFSEAEQTIIGRLIRSVAVAIGSTRSGLPPDADMTATARCGEGRWRAEAIVDSRGKRRRAFAEAGTQELAVARAAAKLCRAPIEVAFAGRTEMDAMAVTIVVIHDADQAPYLGLAVTDPEDQAGSVEAVFSAVGAM